MTVVERPSSCMFYVSSALISDLDKLVVTSLARCVASCCCLTVDTRYTVDVDNSVR